MYVMPGSTEVQLSDKGHDVCAIGGSFFPDVYHCKVVTVEENFLT